MKSCLSGVVCTLVMHSAQAVVFDCVADQVLQSDGREFSIIKVRHSAKYAVDTESGRVSDGINTWGYQVLQQGGTTPERDWVLVYLPEGISPYGSAEDVLRQLPVAATFRIRAWKDSIPFIHDRGGILELGYCRTYRLPADPRQDTYPSR